MNSRYSPLPLQAYEPENPVGCDTSEIKKHPQSTAVWNLFWLSCPDVDTLPGASATWAQHYTPRPDVLAAVVADVTLDDTLFRQLSASPRDFAAWWCRQDCRTFDTYYYLGPKWPINVLERAHQAIARMKPEKSRT